MASSTPSRSPCKEFVDNPAAPPTTGSTSPAVRVVLKQGADVKVDCAFGKEAKDGVYAQVKGESAVKIADKESLEKLNKAEADFVEPPAARAGSRKAVRGRSQGLEWTQR